MIPKPLASPSPTRPLSRLGLALLVSSAAVMVACCGGGGSDPAPAPAPVAPAPEPLPPTPTPPVAADPVAKTLNTTLASPWGLAFLPDGRMLITQKAGTMVILSADGSSTLATLNNLPTVAASGQGGLLDVALDPDFATTPWVYWTYAEPGSGSEAGLAGTAVARGKLVGDTLQEISVIYRQTPKVSGAGHFGSRLAFRADKTLFVSLGERQKESPAQDLKTSLGKIIRINRDGSIPAGNPAFATAGALPEIWSYGHRNPQGIAIHPGTGELWQNEHGPQGGDKINIARAGNNYGWPIRSYGCKYGDPVGNECRIGGGTHAPDYTEPVSYWVPTSIAPAGLTFYTGSKFPEWQSSVFFGALAGTALWRVELNGNVEAKREKLFESLGQRIRCVKQGPDGWLYLLTDGGQLIRIER
ncbi:PQQ-dependent sugar dehydrogenase [Niveibacterium sp. 24ML]|uniref:PQQ-dependent sugar dehydrogenase n=1 Tax=Niveibacterium sp. 24ML TaxID=2985512 RepID=UPI00226E5189|nr:PQQ-dependent sugar dehydrogenase [Niveibacterium sp. 24ML]MCX9155409.1 PQQ-dependent sugar dehydrogenase [Niveibacterium sp. 24ML]